MQVWPAFQLSEQQIIDEIPQRLTGMYPSVPPQEVSRVIRDEHARFEGRPIRDFVPLFVERHAEAELAK
jgi:hypothetical protein